MPDIPSPLATVHLARSHSKSTYYDLVLSPCTCRNLVPSPLVVASLINSNQFRPLKLCWNRLQVRDEYTY